MLKRIIKLAIVLAISVPAISLAGFSWLRASAVAEHDITREIADYRGLDTSLRRAATSPPSRLAVWRAALDHIVSPVHELSDKRLTSFQGLYRDSAGHAYLLFMPSRTDCYVLYRTETDGKLLWKAYVDDSP